MKSMMNEKTTADLEKLRDLIDGVDQQLLHFLHMCQVPVWTTYLISRRPGQ